MIIKEITTFSNESFATTQQLLRQLSDKPSPLTQEQFETIVSAENTHLIHIYNEHSQSVGMLTLCIYRTPSGNRAWIEDVVVDNAFRGAGYGKAITIHAIEVSRQKGADTISLTSHPSRIAANKLYQSLGFQPRDTNVYRMVLETL